MKALVACVVLSVFFSLSPFSLSIFFSSVYPRNIAEYIGILGFWILWCLKLALPHEESAFVAFANSAICRPFPTHPTRSSRLCWLLGTSVLAFDALHLIARAFLSKHMLAACRRERNSDHASHSDSACVLHGTGGSDSTEPTHIDARDIGDISGPSLVANSFLVSKVKS